MAAHASLTGANLHESKGFDTATVGQVRVADGAGGGSMKKITLSEIDTTNIFNINEEFVNVFHTDVNTASISWGVIPIGCTVTKVSGVVYGATTVANTVVTVRNNAGTSMGTITITFAGSAAGQVFTLAAPTNNTFTAGQTIRMDSDGVGTTAVSVMWTVEFTVTA